MREPSPPGAASRRLSAALAAAAALLAAVVYARALRNGIALDDEFIVQVNPAVHGFGRLHDLLLGPYWPQSGELYRPVTLATFAADWALTGGSLPWMHGVNVALHAAATALVVLLVWRLGGGAWAAGAAGAAFAVHPVHVEAVANLVGRAELLATIPVLLACHLFLSDRPRAPAVRIAAISLLYLLALGAKEIAVSLPALLLVLDAVRSRGERVPARRLLVRNLPLLAALAATLAAYLAIRHYALGATVGTAPAPYLRGISTPDRLATAARLVPEYLRLLLWPRDLSAEWGPDAIVPVSWASPLAWAGVAALVLLAVAAWASWRRTRWAAAAVLWLAATLFPVSHVLFPVGVMMAERTLYLASVCLAFLLPPLVAVVARERLAVRRAAAALLAVLLALGALRTWRRTPVWASSNAVFDAMVEEHPELWWVEWKAGQLLVKAGRLDEALPWYRKALAKTRYNHYPMDMDYASLLQAMGRGGEAEPVLRHAIATFPTAVSAYVSLASLRIDQGRYREAVELSRHAAAIRRPGTLLQGHVDHRLALAYDGLGRVDSALAWRRTSLAAPEQRRFAHVWYHYARLLAEAHDPAGAAAALDSARARTEPADRALLRLDPLPPLSSPRLKGWGRIDAPGAAPAEVSPRAPAGPPRPR
jgi:tetratricopeptide (TPR) repeat protein